MQTSLSMQAGIEPALEYTSCKYAQFIFKLQLCKNNEVFQREKFYERFFQVVLCGQSLKRSIGRDQFFGVETLLWYIIAWGQVTRYHYVPAT